MVGTCRYEKMISAFLDGELSESDAEKLLSHISDCSDCRLAMETYAAMDRRLNAMPQIDPSGEFDKRVFAEIAAFEAKQDRLKQLFGWILHSWRLPAALATAALLVFFVIVYPGLHPVMNPGVSVKGETAPSMDETMMAEQLEFFQQYDVINNLELLENWEAVVAFKERS